MGLSVTVRIAARTWSDAFANFESTSKTPSLPTWSVIFAPAPGTFGNSGRNIFRGPGLREWDFSLAKNFKLNDRLRLQLRTNDFSHWFEHQLGLPELARRTDRIDIYTNTLDTARQELSMLVDREASK